MAFSLCFWSKPALIISVLDGAIRRNRLLFFLSVMTHLARDCLTVMQRMGRLGFTQYRPLTKGF